ncbi:MAG: efflux RND transporter periplasmic adaptor subunit [Planctomycetota bacterium]
MVSRTGFSRQRLCQIDSPRGLAGCHGRKLTAQLSLLAWLLLGTLSGCHKEPKATKSAVTGPSTVAHIAKEDQLNTIVLTEKAEERLGIKTAAVEIRPVRRTRTYGGEVTLPTGALIIVSAPLSGTLQAAGKGPVPGVGATINFGQPVFHLLPLLSPEREVLTPAERVRYAEARNAIATARIDAAGQVGQAQVQVDAAQIALERAERLLREMAGTAKAVDDAKAQLALTEKGLVAAKARKGQVDQIKLDDDREAGKLSPLPILAPRDGIIRAEHAVVGEVVTAGTPLFEVMKCDPVWIKVAVYVGDLAEIDQAASGQIGTLAHAPDSPLSAAAPIPAPPTATALSSTVDLYYELKNPDGQYRPGQRLGATLALTGETEQRSIPWSAVIQDIHGGSWVYEMTAPQTFIRRRLQVRQVIDGWTTFDKGPAVGTKIVTAGVAELFGTEFDFAK